MELNKRTKLNTKETFVFYKTPQNIIDWFNSYGISGENFDVFDARKMKSKIVCGMSIPLHVASFAWKTIELNVKNKTGKPLEDLSVEEMDAMWHQVRIYDARSKQIHFEDKNWEKNLQSFKLLKGLANQAALSLVEAGIISEDQLETVEQTIFDGYTK